MRRAALVRRNLTYYWRTNLAVLAGVAAAVAALAGALLVGRSVRASLRELVLERLGNAGAAVTSSGFFRETLAQDFPAACPLIVLSGMITHQESGRRASGVLVYGIDERFWRFHGRRPADTTLAGGQALLSAPLARELGAKPEDGILVRMESPSAIPAESLHGRRDRLGRTIRLSLRAVLSSAEMGEFSLRPQQGAVRAVFVSLRRLQKELDQIQRVNTLLLPSGEGVEKTLRERFELEDLGVRLRALPDRGVVSLESESLILPDALAEKARAVAVKLGLRSQGILTYLANAIRAGEREIPYSLVSAIEAEQGPGGETPGPALSDPPSTIVLNDWAARDLGAKAGDTVSLEYYLWAPEGGLTTSGARFVLKGVVPIRGAAADRDLAPPYPGITDSPDLDDWDPPFPVDLKRIRRRDEDYWDRYRTTPKAFILLERGQALWGSRFGRFTSLRIAPPELERFRAALRQALDPLEMGMSVVPVRSQGIEASQGATDFGEYFVYFSLFLVASALLLAGLFFRLGIEQRRREIGLLRAVGFGPERIRSLFLAEGLALAAGGSAAGLAGAWAYSVLILLGLRTWWAGAVGTDRLTLHLAAAPMMLGGLGGLAAGVICIAWTLRGLRGVSPRSLLSGSAVEASVRDRRWPRAAGAGCAVTAAALLAAAGAGRIPAAGAFFGAGSLLLVSAMCYQWVWLAQRRGRPMSSVARLGFRNAAHRPGRSVLSISLMASAIFLLVAVDAFRRPDRPAWQDPKSGAGGYPLLAQSLLPVVNLAELEDAKFVPFRLRPGDDASCLNLYRPQNPQVLGVPSRFLRQGRFSFQASEGNSENPWLLLEQERADGAIPAIADANSMTYVLHKKLGDEVRVGPHRLRLVAALSRSLFQGELLISESNFQRLFPELSGYRLFLLEQADPGKLEEALADYGFDVTPTADRLAAFDRVENTYLSTFQALGGLGLLLGTVGLAAVLLRNVLERRRELALLQAVGYRSRDLARMVLAENAFLLASGVGAGTLSALVAIAPAFAAQGGRLSPASLGLLLGGVVVTGMAASLAAVRAAMRSPLLEALRAE
jgi:putative ABC transport system permease protein